MIHARALQACLCLLVLPCASHLGGVNPRGNQQSRHAGAVGTKSDASSHFMGHRKYGIPKAMFAFMNKKGRKKKVHPIKHPKKKHAKQKKSGAIGSASATSIERETFNAPAKPVAPNFGISPVKAPIESCAIVTAY